MFTRQDVVIISSIEWDFLWQGPQEIASRLAKAGNRVLYIENTGVRTPTLRDLRRVTKRLFRWTCTLASNGLQSVAPNLRVCSPVVLPPLGRWRREINRRVFLPAVCRAASRLKIRNPVILTFLPTDTAVDLTKMLRGQDSVVVYYCVADFAELSTQPSNILQTESELIKCSDLVLAQCAPLAEHCSKWTANVHIIPYGVNLSDFPIRNDVRKAKYRTESYGRSGGRVIGYVGGLHRHFDFELLRAMAEARPDWSWVCIGPAQTGVARLSELPNVTLVGEVRHDTLAEHIESFDVGIVPYVHSVYTDTVVPTKINEYLAMGKPVVSTDLSSVCEFNRWHGVVITAKPRLDSFMAAIERALALPVDETTIARRRDVAALSDWQARLEHICTLIATAINKKSSEGETTFLQKSVSS